MLYGKPLAGENENGNYYLATPFPNDPTSMISLACQCVAFFYYSAIVPTVYTVPRVSPGVVCVAQICAARANLFTNGACLVVLPPA